MGLMTVGGGDKSNLYIDRVYTTSTSGYSARVYGESGTLNNKNGFTEGASDYVKLDEKYTGELDYGTLGLSSTNFSYTPKFDGYYIDGTENPVKISAGTKLTWSYSVSKNLSFVYFEAK